MVIHNMVRRTDRPPAKSPRGNRVAVAIHRDGCRLDGRVRDFETLIADEPELAGGTDQGPSPLEHLTLSLATCQAILIVKVAEAMGFGFRSLQVVAETDIVFRVGKRFPEPTPRVAKAHIEVEMQSEEPAVRFRELQERVEDRCPVSTLFSDAGIHPEVVWVPNTLIRAN